MSNPEETLDIQTPENVAFGYQVAGIGSRFLAALVDTTITLLLQIAVFVVFILIRNALDLSNTDMEAWVYAIMGLIGFLFYWGYYLFFELLWNGQSPGKRWAGLRVLRSDGTPITITESLIRNLVRLVDFLPLGYGVGILTMFIDSRSRRLGDLAAGTLVVHDQAPISIQSLSVHRAVHLSPRGFAPASLDGFPVERLTNDDLNLIEDFLLRRDELTHRERLAGQILDSLHAHLNLLPPVDNPPDAENTLIAILHAAKNSAGE